MNAATHSQLQRARLDLSSPVNTRPLFSFTSLSYGMWVKELSGWDQETEAYGSPLLSVGDMFQDPQWMPETVDSAKPCVYYVFSYIYILMIKLNS